MVNKLTPEQARRLRLLISSNPEPAPFTAQEDEPGTEGDLSIIGIWDSGRTDRSEHQGELIRERLKRSA